MKKMTLTMVALLSMTAMQAQDNNSIQTAEQAEAKTLILPEGQRPKVMDLNGTPDLRTEHMAKELSLTDEQKAKVLELNKEYQDVFAQNPRQNNMRPRRQPQADGETGATAQQQRRQRPQLTEEQKAEMQQNMEKRKAYNEQLKTILTAEQYEKYQKMQMRRSPRRGQGGPNRQGVRRGPRSGQASTE